MERVPKLELRVTTQIATYALNTNDLCMGINPESAPISTESLPRLVLYIKL